MNFRRFPGVYYYKKNLKQFFGPILNPGLTPAREAGRKRAHRQGTGGEGGVVEGRSAGSGRSGKGEKGGGPDA